MEEPRPGNGLFAEPLSGVVKEKERQAKERMSVFLLTTMMIRIEGETLEPKKQYEVLLDDSVNTWFSGTRMKQVTKSRHRIRYTLIFFLLLLLSHFSRVQLCANP